ncbi:MAG: amidophosphoribosyltransferase [Bdellovibrionales bacterium]|nr:amidophosphoribosyltransferase [Bdellovibrionales bacterium]
MCGVIGMYKQAPVNTEIFDALTSLQHRGQDAAGISTLDESGRLHVVKGAGLVRDVVRTRHMYRLKGNVGIGHVRYPTAGTDSEESAQPFYVNSPFGITLGHNGNLVNTEKLIKELTDKDFRHLNTSSDSEILLNILANELQNQSQGQSEKPSAEHIFKAVEQVQMRCEGAYAVTAIISGLGLLAFRDPNGIRPLVYGKREDEGQTSYLVASETVALDLLGFEFVRNIEPGEVLFIDLEGNLQTHTSSVKKSHTPCLFEFVYMARPDSIMDGISVYKTRLRLGQKLGQLISEQWSDKDIDVVMPIPDTSRTAASVVARILDTKYREGFMKNRYIGRTFIMPGQETRKKSVRQKLNTIDLEFQGKNVLLVDDSIVRGTTSREIVQMAREAGAKNVYFASAAPMVCYPNVYGIDMPAADELIAHGRSVEEVRDLIGADDLIFQSIENLYESCVEGNPDITEFEDSVFTGNYVCGDIDEAYLNKLHENRSRR